MQEVICRFLCSLFQQSEEDEAEGGRTRADDPQRDHKHKGGGANSTFQMFLRGVCRCGSTLTVCPPGLAARNQRTE